ncbi:MAG: tyrosine-protein phosphatase [Erysipelotrichaceae bacterium]|nr:tyrosine-protein phosphatase [Erysipelotrichaceae bacterium]
MVSERIELQSMMNTRDLGSLINKNGRKVRSHRLIRSGELSRASKEDLKILHDVYGLRQIIDLRGEDEMAERPDRTYGEMAAVPLTAMPSRASGVTRDRKFEEEMRQLANTAGPQGARVRMRNFYRIMVSHEFSLSQYHRFIEYLLANKDHASLWHCAVGKDRAGIGAFNVELLLDIDLDDIIEDYLYTNECYFPGLTPRESVFDYYNFAFLEYIEQSLNTINEVFGTTKNYIREGLKISEEMQEEFQKAFLED